MTEEFLAVENMNVIRVDWGGIGGSKSRYTKATANTRLVAREIVYLLKSLQVGITLEVEQRILLEASLTNYCCQNEFCP